MPYRRRYRARGYKRRRYTRRRRAPKRRTYKKSSRYGSRYKSTMGYAKRRSGKVRGGMHVAPKRFARRRKRLLTFKTQPLRQTVTKLSNPTLAEIHPLQARLVSSAGAVTVGWPMTALLGTGGATGTGGSGIVIQLNALHQPSATIDWYPATTANGKRPSLAGQPVGRDEMYAEFKHAMDLRQKVDFHWDIEAPAGVSYSGSATTDTGTTMDLAEIIVGYQWRFDIGRTDNTTTVQQLVDDVSTVTTSTSHFNRLLFNPDSTTSTHPNVFMLGKDNFKHSPFTVYRTIRLRDLQKRKRVSLSTGWVDAQQLAREAAIEAGSSLSLEQIYITQENLTNINSGYYTQVVPFICFPSSASNGDSVRFDFHYEHHHDTLWTGQHATLAS